MAQDVSILGERKRSGFDFARAVPHPLQALTLKVNDDRMTIVDGRCRISDNILVYVQLDVNTVAATRRNTRIRRDLAG
jgi:hypothetical protein